MPINKAPTSPGPLVTAIAFISSNLILASSIAFWVISFRNFICFLAATSGTTPPKSLCISIFKHFVTFP